MTDDALATIRSAIVGGDAYAALQLVRGMGVLREQKPGGDDLEHVRRRRVVATARRESRLYKAERSYEVTSSKSFETPEQIDECIANLQDLKKHMIRRREHTWWFYETYKDWSEDECYRKGIHKPSKPADYPGEGWTPLVLRRPNAPTSPTPPPGDGR